jgi:hypothetical protein
MKTVVISLFDLTGTMVRPWAAAGYECHCYDLQHETTRFEPVGNGGIYYHPWDAEDGIDLIAARFGSSEVAMVFSFTPCTDVAVAGARHFAAKLAADPDCHNRAVRWARLAERLATLLRVPFMVENPVSMLATLWRKSDHQFHPSDYGGYIPEAEAAHPLWPEIIPPRDAYTKKTCLWTSKGFVMPEKLPVERVGNCFHGWKLLGGKSLRTKNIRSATPRGFARAVFLANSTPVAAERAAA